MNVGYLINKMVTTGVVTGGHIDWTRIILIAYP